MKVVRQGKFLDDLTEAYSYLADRNPTAADDFLDEIEVVVDLLAVFPRLGRPREELRAGVRSFRLRRFKHIIFYRLADDAIVLLRILHGARNIQGEMGS